MAGLKRSLRKPFLCSYESMCWSFFAFSLFLVADAPTDMKGKFSRR